jgi:hypothetical protein
VEDSVKALTSDLVDCVILDIGSTKGNDYHIIESIKVMKDWRIFRLLFLPNTIYQRRRTQNKTICRFYCGKNSTFLPENAG